MYTASWCRLVQYSSAAVLQPPTCTSVDSDMLCKHNFMWVPIGSQLMLQLMLHTESLHTES